MTSDIVMHSIRTPDSIVHSIRTPVNTSNGSPPRSPLILGTDPAVDTVPRTFTQEIQRDKEKYSFIIQEINTIVSGIICLGVATGCIVLIAVTNAENCGLNGGAFSILSAIIGGWLACLTTMSAGRKKRQPSISP